MEKLHIAFQNQTVTNIKIGHLVETFGHDLTLNFKVTYTCVYLNRLI